MDPITTMAAIKFGGMAVSAIGGAVSGMERGAAMDAAAKVARENARLAIEKGEYDVGQIRKQADKFLGRQRAAIAQSGTGFGGTNAALQTESMQGITEDVTNTRMEAALRAQDFNRQARDLQTGASQSRVGGLLGSAASLLTTASDAYGSMRRLT